MEISAAPGVQSAALLVDACRLSLEREDSLQLEVVRDLAGDLEEQFEALAQTGVDDAGAAGLLVEAALRCADLANLAACNLPELSPDAAPRAAAGAHLAAGTAHALSILAESDAGELDGTFSDNVSRDARGSRWRAELAVRQADEFLRGEIRRQARSQR